MIRKKQKSEYKEIVEEVIIDCQKRKLKRVEFRPPKRVNVSLQCANSRAGTYASLLLKQSPYLKKLYLHDTKSMEHLELDLNAVDTLARVKSYSNKEMEEYSLRVFLNSYFYLFSLYFVSLGSRYCRNNGHRLQMSNS